ncbi:ribosome assembly factor SBDS [archaeon]|nr:ribosome assembly factor SBDS [archaeon]
MVSLEEAVIARLSTHGSTFEVLVDPVLALDLKRGGDVDISKVLAAETIFKDSKKGDKASEEHMAEVFETDDPVEIAIKIIKKGEIQLTTQQRRQMLDDKRKQIVNHIVRNGINPQSGSPHPPSRIEKAMDEARVQIDLGKTVEEQVTKILKALKPIIPIRFEEKSIAVKIPGQFAAKAFSVVKPYGDVKKEEWLSDGSWAFLIDIPAGMAEEFFNDLNALTKGEVETKIM